MIVCFVAVIFLAFFTGIAVGYIFFEFYAVNNSLIQFNYMEGDDEVDNFLEDIRRSKDNGARMLNIRNGIKVNGMSSSVSSKAPMSMSALLRQNREEADVEQTTVDNPFNNPLEKQNSQDFIQPENAISNEIVDTGINYNSETDNITIDNGNIDENPLTIEDSEFEFTEENVPDDEFDVEDYDNDFLQKYFYDKEISSDDIAESTPVNNDKVSVDETVSADEISDENQNIISDDLMDDIFSSMNDDNNILTNDNETDNASLTSPIPEDEDSTIEKVGKDINNNEEFNDDFMSMLENISINDEITETNTVEEKEENNENTSVKTDKIESSVCISLGGSSTPTEGLLNIPLVMTEKPVEPTEPPKRKRGRPRKKK